MKGKSTTDVIFALRQLQERYREGQQDLHCVFIDLEKKLRQSSYGRTVLVHARQGVLEQCIRLVKNMYHQCESVVRCAAGTSEPFAVEVGLHQRSAFSLFLFSIMMDSLTEKCTLADAVRRLCGAVRKGEIRHGVGTGAVEKRGMKVSRANTEYMCLNGMPLLSVEDSTQAQSEDL